MCNISMFCRNVWCQHLETLSLHEAKKTACSRMNWCNDCESVSDSSTDLIIRLALVVPMVAFSAAMFFYYKVHISGIDCCGVICKTQMFTLGSQSDVCLVQQRKQKQNILSNYIKSILWPKHTVLPFLCRSVIVRCRDERTILSSITLVVLKMETVELKRQESRDHSSAHPGFPGDESVLESEEVYVNLTKKVWTFVNDNVLFLLYSYISNSCTDWLKRQCSERNVASCCVILSPPKLHLHY